VYPGTPFTGISFTWARILDKMRTHDQIRVDSSGRWTTVFEPPLLVMVVEFNFSTSHFPGRTSKSEDRNNGYC
jgi:hypothetical protein